MPYTVEISKWAARDLAEMPKRDRKRVRDKIEALAEDPRPDGCTKLKGEFAGLYRVRAGDFRVIYSIHDAALLVQVIRVRQRGGAYD